DGGMGRAGGGGSEVHGVVGPDVDPPRVVGGALRDVHLVPPAERVLQDGIADGGRLTRVPAVSEPLVVAELVGQLLPGQVHAEAALTDDPHSSDEAASDDAGVDLAPPG